MTDFLITSTLKMYCAEDFAEFMLFYCLKFMILKYKENHLRMLENATISWQIFFKTHPSDCRKFT